MSEAQKIVEEHFGILTDDDLYLDAILVRPANAEDTDIRGLRVWVPKFPLAKESVITCARHEVEAVGADGRIAHLVFDLRGTGNSDRGEPSFDLDIAAVQAWAGERFPNLDRQVAFFGSPYSNCKRVSLMPLRAGVLAETYYYQAAGVPSPDHAPILYLATYGNFSVADDQICQDLAQAGYDVFGMDPLRYLLHASRTGRLTARRLYQDFALLLPLLPAPPSFIGQPIAAGLALLWGAGEGETQGVIAIGQAQIGFKPRHIFNNRNPHTFFLSRYVGKIGPRPAAIVRLRQHSLGGDDDELGSLHQSCTMPRRLVQADQMSSELILELQSWLQHSKQT